MKAVTEEGVGASSKALPRFEKHCDRLGSRCVLEQRCANDDSKDGRSKRASNKETWRCECSV